MQASSTSTTRRRVLVGGTGLVAVGAFSFGASRLGAVPRASSASKLPERSMGSVRTRDGIDIHYKSSGTGPAIVFSHGWPLSSDAWEDQLFFFGSHGFRAIAHDRRGHGRSTQAWAGNDVNGYADDLHDLFEALDLRNVTLVGHSTGAGEVARYIGRHGTGRLRKAVLVSGIPPLRLRTAANSGGAPISAFDDVRRQVLADRAEFYRGLATPFYGLNRPGGGVSQGTRDAFWQQCMMAGLKAVHDGIKAQSETDFSMDLRRFDVPTLIIHGEADQLVPIDNSARLQAQLIRRAKLEVYPAAPHGLPVTHRDRFNADLLAFARA